MSIGEFQLGEYLSGGVQRLIARAIVIAKGDRKESRFSQTFWCLRRRHLSNAARTPKTVRTYRRFLSRQYRAAVIFTARAAIRAATVIAPIAPHPMNFPPRTGRIFSRKPRISVYVLY